MSKHIHFTRQPVFGQLLSFLDKGQINRVSKELGQLLMAEAQFVPPTGVLRLALNATIRHTISP
ncbi:MAG: hypothetical protein QM654_13610 [Dysgonamonadaceae bacterium]